MNKTFRMTILQHITDFNIHLITLTPWTAEHLIFFIIEKKMFVHICVCLWAWFVFCFYICFAHTLYTMSFTDILKLSSNACEIEE